MPRKGLSTEVQEEIWNRVTLKNESLKSVAADKGLTYNQIRETLRRYRHQIAYKVPEKQLALLDTKINTLEIRRKALDQLNELISSVDSDTADKINAIRAQLTVADSIDRYEGRGTPHTQINIIQIKTLEGILDKLMEWVAVNLSPDLQSKFTSFMDQVEADRPVIDVVGEDVRDAN